MNLGVAGEVRFVVKGADGCVKLDTGFNKNIILNQGLDFLGDGFGSNMFTSCVVGSGNSEPAFTQNSLDSFQAVASPEVGEIIKNDYVNDGSGLYKTSKTKTYKFESLSDVNISEVGLASQYSSPSSYYLCTRALIKNTLGEAVTITVKAGEVLEVSYTLWEVFSTTDNSTTVNMLDGDGGAIAYNTISRIAGVTSLNSEYGKYIGRPMLISSAPIYAYLSDLATIQESPSGARLDLTKVISDYTVGTYKQVVTLNAALSDVLDVRTIVIVGVNCSVGCWQIRYGAADGDSAIVKTNKFSLSVPLEVSWGRYEGVL